MSVPPHSQKLRQLLPNAEFIAQPAIDRSPVLPKRQTRAIAACENCRKRKTKCLGQRPICSSCVDVGLDCQYSSAENETPSQSIKRQLRAFEKEVVQHRKIFKFLQTRDEYALHPILSRIRSGADIETVVRLIEDGDLVYQISMKPPSTGSFDFPYINSIPAALLGMAENPYLDAWICRIHENNENIAEKSLSREGVHHYIYEIPFQTAKMVEPRLSAIKAASWTNVPCTDDMMRELVSIYFLSENHFISYIHKDLFLEDMIAERQRFCSPLLVNAILAVGSLGSRLQKDHVKFWDPQSLAYQFLAEAKRLWEADVGEKTKVTTIQAGALIGMYCCSSGIDKIGVDYAIQATTLARGLGLFSTSLYAKLKSRKRRAVYAMTAWGLFDWSSMYSFHYHQKPLLRHPPPVSTAIESSDPLSCEIWIKYPGIHDPVPTFAPLTIRAARELRAIMHDIAYRSFGPPRTIEDMTLKEALNYYERLRFWYESLPVPLSAQRVVFPSQLKLHMHYHHAVATLFEPFVSIEIDDALPNRYSEPGFEIQPREIVANAKMRLEMLIRLFYQRHGPEQIDSMMVIFYLTAASNSCNTLVSGTDEATRKAALSTIILCAKALSEMKRNYYAAEAVMLILRHAIDDNHLPLIRSFVDIEDDSGRMALVSQQCRSSWPFNINSLSKNPDERRLDRLINALNRFAVEDSEGESVISSEPSD